MSAPLPTIGDIVPCSCLAGEVVDGPAAGLPDGYRLRGVGLRPMREIRQPDELTSCCSSSDAEWAAEIIASPAPRDCEESDS